jgi:hypothetical protein
MLVRCSYLLKARCLAANRRMDENENYCDGRARWRFVNECEQGARPGSVSQRPIGVASDQAASDEDIKLFRKDSKFLKKQIVAANMDLTENESQQFWPVYDRYTADLVTISDKKYALLKDYAQNYITSEQAESYIRGRAAVEQAIMELRLKYISIFAECCLAKRRRSFSNWIGASD